MHTCISSHGLKRSWHSCPRRVNAGNKNTPSTHHPRRRNVTTLIFGLKNGHIRKNLTQSGEPQRYSWGTQKKKKKKKKNLIGSLMGSLSCLMQHCGYRPPLRRIFQVEGIFPLELTWVLIPFPPNYFRWEYKPRSSLCTHAFHCMDSKHPDIHALEGWMPATKMHPACTIHKYRLWLPQWLD